MIMAVFLSSLNSKGPESTEKALIAGYYFGFILILTFGIVLILLGIRILKKLKNKKIKKSLLDSLPGDDN